MYTKCTDKKKYWEGLVDEQYQEDGEVITLRFAQEEAL